jgi:hypothetical protein
MKKVFAAFGFLLTIIALTAVYGQNNQHGVLLAWTESDTSTTVTFNVLRLTGACPTSNTGFIKVNIAPIATLSYFDPAPVPNGATVCYEIVAQDNGLDSPPSPTVQVVYLPPPFAPNKPSATIR